MCNAKDKYQVSLQENKVGFPIPFLRVLCAAPLTSSIKLKKHA